MNMSKIQWLGSAATVGQVTLRSTSRINVPVTLVPDVRRAPMLRETPGQWSFQIKVGRQLMGTCEPRRMEKAIAQSYANFFYNFIVSPFPQLLAVNTAYCNTVLSKAREIYLRIHQPVTIVASRNGVYRFTWSGSGVVAGVPEEEEGTLGQIETFEECFANPDCDACWREQFAAAQRACSTGFEGYDSRDQCVNELARQFTREQCFPNFGGTGTRINAYPWRQSSDETCLHQDQVNAVLRDNGYQPIARDCKLGPLTCGASSVATQLDSSVGIPDTCFAHQGEWVLPAQAGAPPPVEPAPAPPPPPPPAPTASKGIGAGGLALLAAVLAGGIWLVTQVA
jgi:hypothetical protein